MAQIITMTSKGQFTLPANVRRALGLHKPGEKLTLDLNAASQQIVLSKPISFADIQARSQKYIKPGTTPLTDADAFYNTREPRL
jgi:bifunctional DNA-binding transcriptional regulator/antitoxin component of YhaV-PrlF toxin-antitoxin module